jgi:hypothetical protein
MSRYETRVREAIQDIDKWVLTVVKPVLIESVAMYPWPLVFCELLTRTSLLMFKTVAFPQGDWTVDTRSKLSR